MQRYYAGSCTSAVNNSGISGVSSRDVGRSDSSSLPANYSVNSRRQLQLAPYRLKCDKDPLNPRLGPPDFHPQTTNCPEETLTKEYIQAGYKEIIEGVEDARELSLTQVGTFTNPVVLKCKEAIRKRQRAINDSRTQKRKAGQVYGVPLHGALLCKAGLFPELKACGEDSRKRWIEGLSQYHKSLQELADHVPHGYRKRSLFEVLIRNNVPLLRATWFIKITYLNQIRRGPSGVSYETSDKSQLSRTELWTKDVTDYLQYLLDEYLCRNNTHSALQSRDRSPQMLYSGASQHKSDSAHGGLSDEPSLHFKWWYVVRLVHWHYNEGLILASPLVDWVILQLQEKDLIQVLELLLPIIYGVSESIILCQTYVRKLVDVALRFLKEGTSGGSNLVDNSRRAYTTSALVEMLRYLILSVPDTLVGMNCFPLPHSVLSHTEYEGNPFSKLPADAESLRSGAPRRLELQFQSSCLSHVVASIQKRAAYLTKASNPGYMGKNGAKAVQALNATLVHGDIGEAYKVIFEDVSDVVGDDSWVKDINPCLRPWLYLIDTVSISFICSVFLLCEWCTCDYGNFRTAPIHDLKFTGRKDFSHIHIAARLLKERMGSMPKPGKSDKVKTGKSMEIQRTSKGPSWQENPSIWNTDRGLYGSKPNTMPVARSTIELSDLFESPNPFHDVIVCWIDQHNVCKGEAFDRTLLFLVELIRCGLFSPLAYVRQLLISGVMDNNGPVGNMDKRICHSRILKQLPPAYVRNALEEACIAEVPLLLESLQIYGNERRLLLRGLLSDDIKRPKSKTALDEKVKHSPQLLTDSFSPASGLLRTSQPVTNSFSSTFSRHDGSIEEIKAAISDLLQFPKEFLLSGLTVDELPSRIKRPVGLISSNLEGEGIIGCEECKKAKRQRVSEEGIPSVQILSLNPMDEEDSWWTRKEPKSTEFVKSDTPLKATRQATRGRQKGVRKTQSLAQLAAARIEGSQGASTSHVCDNRTVCPHHRTGIEGETSKPVTGVKETEVTDLISIGKMLKQRRFVERRSIGIWLMSSVKHLVEEYEKTAKGGELMDERSSLQWKLGEDELSVILYLMDMSNDLALAIRFLIWLLPKAVGSASTPIHGGRSTMTLRHVEGHTCEVGEPFLLSCIRRYENILVAADLVPDVLSSTMQRAAAVISSNGRLSSSPTFFYARYLLKKHGMVSSVVEWEKTFKANSDRRLISELESGRLQNGEYGFPLGVPSGVENVDDFIRQKISGNRLSRAGNNMREIVSKCVEDMLHHLFAKERKLFAAGAHKSAGMEKWDDGYQIAQQIVMGLMDCIRQTGGAAQEGDPSLVSSAVSAIVGNVGPALARMPDFTSMSNHSNFPSATGSLGFARRILRVHLNCLCLLKDALGERHSRTFEIALATEASSALAAVLTSGKAHDSSATLSNDSNNSTKVVVGRATKIAAAVSALIVGAMIHGVASLERMVRVFRLREGLDVMKYVKSTRSNSNGNARSAGSVKLDNSVEVYIHWFRLLVGNSRAVCDGLVVELLGEPSIIALSRMQRTLPLDMILPPAYSIFGFLIWRPFVFSNHMAGREDTHQLFQSMASAIGDVIKHTPFRDVCLTDTRGFYDIVTSDPTELELAAVPEVNRSEKHLKTIFAPTRARLFLNAVIDCKLPHSVQEEGFRQSVHDDSKMLYQESETKISERLVHAVDMLQLAKFHWQWVEIRLLLNEQELYSCMAESMADVMRSLAPGSEKKNASDSENNFIEVVLTRLLVRPDAAPLFSEVLHLCGRQIESAMLVLVKWFLAGSDVLYGRKSVRHRLSKIAESKGFSTKVQFWKPWGWSSTSTDLETNLGKRSASMALEEGEVGEAGPVLRKQGRGSTHMSDDRCSPCQLQLMTEKALIDLLLPCLDRSPADARNLLATDLVKQLHNIEQNINGYTGGATKLGVASPSGTENSTSKVTNRRGNMKAGSPGLARRSGGSSSDISSPSSPSALRASISLRLLLLLRLLPNVCVEGETTKSTLRSTLAMVILRLLGHRIVYEDVAVSSTTGLATSLKRSLDLEKESSACVSLDLSGRNIFDWLILVLHALLSPSQPCWLKAKTTSKPTTSEHSKFASGIDRETLELLQNELEGLQIPDAVRWRIKAAMPVLFTYKQTCISCQPPTVSPSALTSLEPSSSPQSALPVTSVKNSSSTARRPAATSNTPQVKQKSSLHSPPPDHMEIETDPWTLLEEGAGSGPCANNLSTVGRSDHSSHFKASSWLRGAVRVRRTDLTYIGAMDEDS